MPARAVRRPWSWSRRPAAFAREVLLAFGQCRPVGREQGQRERLPLLVQGLVLLGLARLALERAELPADLVHDVAHPLQVLARRLELALRLRALLLVARHPRRLLDEDPPLPRLGGEDVVEALLVHERVRLGVDAGPREQVLDVPEAALVAVQQVLAVPAPVQAPRHRDLAPRHGQAPVVGETQVDLGHAERAARLRAVKDDIFHLVAAQEPGTLLAEGPPHGIGHVGLPAAVGPDDAGDAGQDAELGLLREGLEAVDEDLFEPHVVEAKPYDCLSRWGESHQEKSTTPGGEAAAPALDLESGSRSGLPSPPGRPRSSTGLGGPAPGRVRSRKAAAPSSGQRIPRLARDGAAVDRGPAPAAVGPR